MLQFFLKLSWHSKYVEQKLVEEEQTSSLFFKSNGHHKYYSFCV